MPIDVEISEIFAMWEYDSMEQFEQIEEQIRADEAHVNRVQARLDLIGRERIKTAWRENIKQQFFTSTVDRNDTILSSREK